MTPTMKLRFVEREIEIPFQTKAKKIRVLQQWWAVERNGKVTPDGEWRDVPLEVESE